MRWGESHGRTRGPTDVEAVHPGVASEDRVDQIAELPLLCLERRILLHSDDTAEQSWRAPTGLDRLGRCGRQIVDNGIRRHGSTLIDLGGGHGIDHLSACPLAGRSEVVSELAHRCLCFGHAKHMGGHGAYIPKLARGGLAPILR